ncbi:MAG: divalent-cation tolerance protein CutA [Gemmatimonadetes bacterium]|nr:divalent-cation tolerance protein CutA [Gemmatimonadota bacterium]
MNEPNGAGFAEAGLIFVITTLADAAAGERLVHTLLDDGLIACGNLLPGMTSIYRWKGSIERADEVMVILKTRSSLADPLFSRIAELHPYEVPELVALPVAKVSHAYSAWVRQETNEVSS